MEIVSAMLHDKAEGGDFVDHHYNNTDHSDHEYSGESGDV